jgi:serine/threonine protein kinase
MKRDERVEFLAQFEDFILDIRTGELRREGGKSIRLPEQSFQILTMLLERPGELVSREEIRKRLWPNDTVVEFEHSISAAMNRLRLALRESASQPHYIETLARRGYRWNRPVEWIAATPASAQTPVTTPATVTGLIGRRVSHYRVLEMLGGGGMGVVYKAEDIKLGRRVALKFLPEELTGDERAVKRFEREARAASALNHPNICTVHEIEEHDGQPFIVMELLDGQMLRELISGTSEASKLPLSTVLNLAIQITEGLDAAHRKGIIHRDIKPSNIFVTTRGDAKILDFGVAKLLEFDGVAEPEPGDEIGDDTKQPENPPLRSLNLTRTGAALGTEGYMSPEQVRGERLDTRTDLFSFGLVLYELATGRRAFTGETAAVLNQAILNESPRPARQFNSTLPPALEGIINKALEKDRELRYQHATEIRDDLKSLRLGMGHNAPRQIANMALRSRRLVVAGGFSVALIVAIGMLWLKRKHPSDPPILMRQRQLTINSSENPVSSGAISPDGKYLAYADLSGIHITLISTGETRTIPQPDSLSGIQVNWGIINGWVPDGTRLIANAIIPGRETSVWVVPVTGGPPHKLRDDAYAGSISRDGTWVAFLANLGEFGYREVWLMRPDGTRAHKLYEGDANNAFLGADWSPDSHRLSFEWGRRLGEKVAWNMISRDLNGGPAATAIHSGIEDWSWSPDGRMIYSLDEPGSAGNSCNFWMVNLDRRTGEPLGPARRITNWAGFCMDNPCATADGKKLSFRRWSPQGSVYIAALTDNGTRTKPPIRLTLNEGLNYPASWTSDNNSVIFESYRDGRWRILRQALNEDMARPIETGADDDAVGGRLSPDGASVFYISLPRSEVSSPPYKLMSAPVSGGLPRSIMTANTYGGPHCSRLPANVCAIAQQTPDRQHLVFTAFDITGPGPQLLRFDTEPKSYFDYLWDLSPDGTRIAILRSSTSRIEIHSLRGAAPSEIVAKDGSSLESVNWTADGTGLFASSHTKGSVVLLRLDQKGNTHIVWEHRGSIAPWNWPFQQWVGGTSAPFALPSPDGRYLAIYEWSLSANMWMIENF